jgi:hypothetical protein
LAPAAKPSWTKWRIALDSETLSDCLAAHASTACLSSGGMRSAMSGSFPVAGRPGPLFSDFGITFIDFVMMPGYT